MHTYGSHTITGVVYSSPCNECGWSNLTSVDLFHPTLCVHCNGGSVTHLPHACAHTHTHTHTHTQVFDNYAVTVMIGGEPYTLGLFDTAGKHTSHLPLPLFSPWLCHILNSGTLLDHLFCLWLLVWWW